MTYPYQIAGFGREIGHLVCKRSRPARDPRFGSTTTPVFSRIDRANVVCDCGDKFSFQENDQIRIADESHADEIERYEIEVSS